MLTKCIWCNVNPVEVKRTCLCNYCNNLVRVSGVPATNFERACRVERRGRFKISNSKRITNLINKYGVEIIDDFELLRSSPAWTLERLGEKHGFTRERARQLFRTIFKESYTKAHKKKMATYKKDIGCVNDPRYKFAEYKRSGCNTWKSAKTEKMFFDECESRGLEPEILCSNAVDIKINGYMIDVKSCFAPQLVPGAKTQNLRFKISTKQRKKCDFIACYHSTEKSFFIVPREFFPEGSQLYISETMTDYYGSKNKYWEYKDAWHLLETPNDAPGPDTGQPAVIVRVAAQKDSPLKI